MRRPAGTGGVQSRYGLKASVHSAHRRAKLLQAGRQPVNSVRLLQAERVCKLVASRMDSAQSGREPNGPDGASAAQPPRAIIQRGAKAGQHSDLSPNPELHVRVRTSYIK